jgi:tetraacyldisaccharide 4'-kinase
VQAFIRAQWDKRGIWAWLWLPLSLLVCALAALKRKAYKWGLFKTSRITAPVLVIGNLSVGGAGKTPLVAHIAELLSNHGYQPGIISRGYKGSARHWPQNVTPESDPLKVGDEPVMLAALTGCPVVAGPDRARSAQQLVDQNNCDVILSDDGFQHLKLARDINILVFDTALNDGLGNRWCLPSGPLREPASARRAADMQVFHGSAPEERKGAAYAMTLLPGEIYAQKDKAIASMDHLKQQPLHAVAGIGNPMRFFTSARSLGLTILEQPFNDHHLFTEVDLQFDDEYDVVTTQKDAIKLARIATRRTIWVLPVQASPGKRFDTDLLEKLRTL